MSSPLHYLTVELTEGSDEVQTLEAMASTREAQHGAVMAEVQSLLAWARQHFGDRHGPVEEGNAWDDELLVQREADGWVTVTLALSASAEFVDAFLPVFGDREE